MFKKAIKFDNLKARRCLNTHKYVDVMISTHSNRIEMAQCVKNGADFGPYGNTLTIVDRPGNKLTIFRKCSNQINGEITADMVQRRMLERLQPKLFERLFSKDFIEFSMDIRNKTSLNLAKKYDEFGSLHFLKASPNMFQTKNLVLQLNEVLKKKKLNWKYKLDFKTFRFRNRNSRWWLIKANKINLL